MLWHRLGTLPQVTDIEYHEAYKKVCDWPKGVAADCDGESLHLCSLRKVRTPRASVKFDDKVDAAVEVGFVERALGEEIKGFYKLRNSIHIEAAVKNQARFEVDQAAIMH